MTEPSGSSSVFDAALAVVRTLRQARHTAYFAGGCVRDALLGLTPKDYDVATDAKPETVRALFRGSRLVGEAFGVVLAKSHGCWIEVATFRAEGGYDDGRRPSRVHFTDAEHDAKRRDFTVNGLFADPLAEPADHDSSIGRVIDFVGGRDDLQRKLIRAIGNPDERFGEDYLRLLRAVRFAARLRFDIEPATAAAIRAHATKLAAISRERIGQEVGWMLAPAPAPAPAPGSGKTDPPRAAALMQELGLDAPALDEPHRDVPLPTLTSVAMVQPKSLSGDAAYAVILAAWLLDRHGEPQGPVLRKIIAGWRKALCLSNEQTDALAGTLELLPRYRAWPTLTKPQRKRLLASTCAEPAWRLLAARPGCTDLIETITAESAPLIQEGVAPAPLVDGNDLIGLGLKPGPAFGRLLEQAYDAQLDGLLPSREDALAWLRERTR